MAICDESKRHPGYEKLCDQLLAERDEALRDSVQRIANEVCGKLPHGYLLSLYMENGAAWVELDEGGLVPLNEDSSSSIHDQIFDALTIALNLPPILQNQAE